MAKISEVPGLTGPALELFKAAEIGTIDEFLSRSEGAVMEALAEANGRLKIAERLPSRTAIEAWQGAARILDHRLPEAKGALSPMPVGPKGRDPAPPVAGVVSEEQLRAAGVDVDAVPVAKVIENAPPPQPARRVPRATLEEDGFAIRKDPPKAQGDFEPGPRKVVEPNPESKAEVRSEFVAPFEKPIPKPSPQPAPSAGSTAPTPDPAPESFVAESEQQFRKLEAVKESKPQGERRNRGMSHPDAGRVRLAATVTVLAPLVCVLTAAALGGALFMAYYKGWVFPPTLALLLLVFPIALFFYVGFGTKARCRLCGQKLFVPKHCRKHVGAKRSIFGYTFAVARDAMLRANYRCIYCGTKTRLKD